MDSDDDSDGDSNGMEEKKELNKGVKLEEILDKREEEEIEVYEDFLTVYLSVREEIKEVLNKLWKAEYSICSSGHSLGGALANIFALDFHNLLKHNENHSSNDILHLFTLGAPRVGNLAFANAVNKAVNGFNMRITFNEDIITEIPRNASYVHAGNEI
eukprot:CAMPEP_0170516642 /NCGR_PEP_ID=MMETSP0209-20121228/2808_1 /TAXON_ID=665100 ORGANISM="Litonotus pictus, Strain P1" /NCGR_SAMPLE_ID=MMETSP0209 /ASSEMBLY_ACC=CAM_ASM_000301 /LENGTH=157 /DNA_ID=CAMNT_0010801599 /DNA_START=450 /DNA_END=920 /DNA_ORIENTATION=+